MIEKKQETRARDNGRYGGSLRVPSNDHLWGHMSAGNAIDIQLLQRGIVFSFPPISQIVKIPV